MFIIPSCPVEVNWSTLEHDKHVKYNEYYDVGDYGTPDNIAEFLFGKEAEEEEKDGNLYEADLGEV